MIEGHDIKTEIKSRTMPARTLIVLGGKDIAIKGRDGKSMKMGEALEDIYSGKMKDMTDKDVMEAYKEVTQKTQKEVMKANAVRLAVETIHNKVLDFVDGVLIKETGNKDVYDYWKDVKFKIEDHKSVESNKNSQDFQNSDVAIRNALDSAERTMEEYFSKDSESFRLLSKSTQDWITTRLDLREGGSKRQFTQKPRTSKKWNILSARHILPKMCPENTPGREVPMLSSLGKTLQRFSNILSRHWKKGAGKFGMEKGPRRRFGTGLQLRGKTNRQH